jgi:hypothetical protein
MFRNRILFIPILMVILVFITAGCASTGEDAGPQTAESETTKEEPAADNGPTADSGPSAVEEGNGDQDEGPIWISAGIPETPERILHVPDIELHEAAIPRLGPAGKDEQAVSDKPDHGSYIGKSVLDAVRIVKVLFEVAKNYSRFETMYRISLRQRYAALAEEKEELIAANENLRSELKTAEKRLQNLEERIALQKKEPAAEASAEEESVQEDEKAGVDTAAEDADDIPGSPSGPADEKEWRRKHVYAVPEDIIAISMGGTGWIYLGEKNSGKGVIFKSRKNSPRATEFVFQTTKLGDFFLQFQQQDLFTGEERWQEVRVSVVDEARFAEILTAKRSGKEEDPAIMDASPKGYILADTYYKEGRKIEALAEYIKNYTEGNPRVNDRIAHLSFEQEKYDQAELYWRKNLYEEDIYREKAIIGIIRTAVRRDDIHTFEKMLPELLLIETVPTAEPLLEGARFQIEKGNKASAANILSSFLVRYYDHEKADWVYFTLGNLHEQSGPLRDFKKAKYYYRVVLNDFPSSSYWDRADERIRYIDMYLLKTR